MFYYVILSALLSILFCLILYGASVSYVYFLYGAGVSRRRWHRSAWKFAR